MLVLKLEIFFPGQPDAMQADRVKLILVTFIVDKWIALAYHFECCSTSQKHAPSYFLCKQGINCPFNSR